MATQFVELEWWGDFGALYCPVCGATLYRLEIEESDWVDPPKCKHLLFSYIPDISEFDYVGDCVKELVGQVMAEIEAAEESDDVDSDDVRNPASLVLERLNSDSVFGLSITTCGVACGPVSQTVQVAFDFRAGESAT